jgi:hypothetical protein
MRIRTTTVSLCILAACGTETIIEPAPVPTPTVPMEPFGVNAESGIGYLRVEWTDRSDNESKFVVGRAELPTVDAVPTVEALSVLATVTADQRSYRDDTALVGKFYAYGVAAENAAGRSAFVLQTGPAIGSTATSSGACKISVPSAEDQDGDGLSDEIEGEGWTVRIDENGAGTFSEREVSSGTSSADGDGDGLCDALERILRTDPNRADTDNDGLDDADEVEIWGSSPINVDSDADAHGNPAFYDGAELDRYGTSPTLADTDGDGRDDFVEINQNSTNALLADLPQPQINLVGTIDLGVNVRLANGTTEENAVTQSLAQGTETATGKTNSVATTVSSETSVEVGASAEVSFPAGASVSVSASYGETDGYMKETASSVSQSSANNSQTAYAAATSREISQQETIENGRLAVQLEIANVGARTFELSNLVVTALTRDPRNPKSFTSIATLRLPTEANVTMAQGEPPRGPFRVEAELAANDALSLLANPTALYFRPASFSLKDRTGQSFEFSIGEATSNRTALLVIDYGGGRELETYRVATNVARKSGGKIAGVRMGDVLEDILDLAPNDDQGYRTQANSQGVRILTQVRNQAVQQAGSGSSKFWVVIAAENASSGESAAKRLLDPAVHFEDLILMPRDRVYLSFEADEDRDRLFAREELRYRTSDTDEDSDDDGLTDFEEARVGWNVFSNLAYYANNPVVYSSPTRADADGDGLDDAAEKAKGTDPNRGDTDGDGVADDVDPQPLAGLSAPYVRSFGTVSTEFVNGFAVDDEQNIYLTGSGGGDIDNDGIIGSAGFYTSAFIGSWDASGNERWITQFETIEAAASNVVVDSSGHTFWVGALNQYSGFGVTDRGTYLVELDVDGSAIGMTKLSNPPLEGALLGFGPRQLQAGPNGKWFVIGTNGISVHWFIFDGTGLVSAYQTYGPGAGIADFQVGATSMEINLFSGCTTIDLDWNGASIGSSNYCATGPSIPRGVRLEDRSFFKGENDGSVSRFDPAGTLLWTSRTPPGIDFIYSLHVDALGRSYVTGKANAVNSPLIAYSVTAGGSPGFEITIPSLDAYTQYVDPIGNYYLAGQSSDGLDGLLPARGGLDLIVLRNPQLIFP